MTWENTLLDAKFRGTSFDVIETDDDFSHALVEHTYPYVDGADVEDMGREARRITVKAIFYGDDYETRLDTFLMLLDQPGTGEFIHPVFGSIKNAKAKRFPVHHDAESPDQATLVIEFIESTTGNPFFDTTQSAKLKSADIAAKSAIAKAITVSKYASIITAIQAANPMASLNALRTAITGPILAAMSFANAVLANLDVLAYPQSWANDFQTLISGALAVRGWGANLVAEWASIQSTFSELDIFSSSSAGAQPSPADSTSAIPPSQMQAVAVAQATVGIFQATGLADAVTLAFAAIADAQTSATTSTTATSSTAAPITPGAPLLSPDDIEAMSNTVRTAIEASITQVRAVYTLESSRDIVEALKDLALSIQLTAAALIESRPPLVQRTVTAPGNMRLLAHQLYGDASRAPELWLLNNARSPFVNTGDVINAFAV